MTPDGPILIVGAGASIAAPTRLPAFVPLASHIMRSLGWERVMMPNGHERWSRSDAPFPSIQPPWAGSLPPEVVFGTLHRYGVPFEAPLERLMRDAEPNVAHQLCAAVLGAGGSVWTPNIDTAVERACARAGVRFERRGGPAVGSRNVGDDLARTLVKFHGSADIPGSLAFTHLDLLRPMSCDSVDGFREFARGRHVVLYGYAGADADLLPLLIATFEVAAEIVWFEPFSDVRERIGTVFARHSIQFEPPVLTGDFKVDLRAMADRFVELVRSYGAAPSVDRDGLRMLGESPTLRYPDLEIDVPEIVHARLVERFGSPSEERLALSIARRRDLLAGRVHTTVDYVRWAASRSLYHDGVLATLVMGSTPAHVLRALRTGRLGLRRWRNFVFEKGPTLMIRQARWREVLDLSDVVLTERRRASEAVRPADLYFRAYGLRYAMRLDEARECAVAAERGFTGEGADPDSERLASAVLEQGILDVYQGRFVDAYDRGVDLFARRGRYAAQNWSAWGAWLAGLAKTYLLEFHEADRHLRFALESFTVSGRTQARNDVVAAMLFRSTVGEALGVPGPPLPRSSSYDLTRFQRDDLRLIGAERALARGDVHAADTLLRSVLSCPSNSVARAWARFGIAEVRCRQGLRPTGFAKVRSDAAASGAKWLELQALTRLDGSGEASTASDIAQVKGQMQLAHGCDDGKTLRAPLLWLMT